MNWIISAALGIARASSALRSLARDLKMILVKDIVEEVVQGLEGSQVGSHALHPVVAVEVLLRWPHHQDVLLHLEVAGQRMVLGIVLGHSLERVALPLIARCDVGVLDNAQELLGLGVDEAAQTCKNVLLGPPDAATHHQLVGLEVHIVSRDDGMPPAFADHARKIVLVGALVVTETDVAVDAVDTILDDQSAHIVVIVGHHADEALHVLFPWLSQGIELIFVRLEPCAVVIGLQLPQKSQHLFYITC